MKDTRILTDVITESVSILVENCINDSASASACS